MAQKLVSTTANAVIAFQQVPGIDNNTIIDAGAAQNRTTLQAVNPVSGGYYGIRWNGHNHQDLEILGTTYRVYRLAQNTALPALGAAPAPLPAGWPPVQIGAWASLWSQTAQQKVQHSLQLMGYYRGPIDGNLLAVDCEEALLNFQADTDRLTNGLEWLHAWPDPPAYPGAPDAGKVGELEDAVNDSNRVTNNQTGAHVYLIRKPLLRFVRSPDGGNADAEFGNPDPEAPDVDVRGFISVDTCGHDCPGPVVSMAYETRGTGGQPGYRFRVKVTRDGIADSVPLVAESDNPNLVSVTTVNMTPTHNMNLVMRTGDPGNPPGLARVLIKWQRGVNDLVTIATLHVIVLPMTTLKIRPFRVTIYDDSAHLRGQVAAAAQVNLTPQRSNVQLDASFQRLDDIWRPYGIRFQILPWKERHVTLQRAGEVSAESMTREISHVFDHIDNPRFKIGVYFVRAIRKPGLGPNRIQGPFGATHSPLRCPNRRVGIVMQDRSEGANALEQAQRTGDTLAHEIGHFIGLANNFDNPNRAHTEDDPDAGHPRHDCWTVRRLMLGTAPDVIAAGRPWAWVNGYWDPNSVDASIRGKIRGNMISLRHLPQDHTDNECTNARSRADKSNPYRGGHMPGLFH
jgi:TusA-related sulfurtransferase